MTPVQDQVAHRAQGRLDGHGGFFTGSFRWAQEQVSHLSAALEEEVHCRTEELKAIGDREHSLAEMLRRSLLCPDAEYRQDGLRLTAASEVTPQEALVGGDFYDFFPLDGRRVAVVLGDICGKGMVAAVQVPAIKFALRAYLCQGASPGEALARLNQFLIERVRLDSAQSADPVALTLLVLDSMTGTGIAAAAGANPVIALREFGSLEVIEVSGLPLGVIAGHSYADVPLALSPGELFLLTTDGITEARRGAAMLYPEGTAQMALQAQRDAPAPFCSNDACFCGDLLKTIRTDVMDGARAFDGGAFRDDAALVLVRLCPGATEATESR